ncbi:MAG TPA: polyhydroxyalkanoate depolymerase [Stellaceae bacterium]|nr:polyhydroxyalkanoate depolymerase [Stellaceae bacterium]
MYRKLSGRRAGSTKHQMMYYAYQAYADAMTPIQALASATAELMERSWPGFPGAELQRRFAASCSLLGGAHLTHKRPPFGIDSIRANGHEVVVHEEVAAATAFGSLLHFAKEGAETQPRVLLVSPMSGHFATLLRHTIRTMLPDHDVYVTDWHNARDIPVSEGSFGFDDYIAHVIEFIEAIGGGAHAIGVCQPAVAVLAAVALMEAADNPARPATMTLMGGPIDTTRAPTKVTELAERHSLAWFEANLISPVPFPHEGAGRRVYPGFLQLGAFMAMNPMRHARAFGRYYEALVDHDAGGLAAHHAFYDEYFAVMDLPAEFYLETVDKVFHRQELARGTLAWRGMKVDPGAIRRTALLTVEGERDDICAVGQTSVAHELCSGLPADKKQHHLQEGVGHYGVFSGRRWAGEVYPRIRDFIRAHG